MNFKNTQTEQTFQCTPTRSVKNYSAYRIQKFQNYWKKAKKIRLFKAENQKTLALETLCWEPSCNTNWADQSGKNQLGSSNRRSSSGFEDERSWGGALQPQALESRPAIALTTKPQVAQNWKMMNEDLLIHIWKVGADAPNSFFWVHGLGPKVKANPICWFK